MNATVLFRTFYFSTLLLCASFAVFAIAVGRETFHRFVKLEFLMLEGGSLLVRRVASRLALFLLDRLELAIPWLVDTPVAWALPARVGVAPVVLGPIPRFGLLEGIR